jgi:hypothetical protein
MFNWTRVNGNSAFRIGTIEIIICNYNQLLAKKGHEVIIVNDNNSKNIIKIFNVYNPNFVHIHYDDYFDILNLSMKQMIKFELIKLNNIYNSIFFKV